MSRLQLFFVRHQRTLRAAWLVALLVLASCQPDSNGGDPGGDGY